MTKDSDPLPWCVQHRDGWCLTKSGMLPRSDINVPTKCGHFVIAAYGFERTEPTCPLCRANTRGQQP